MTMLNAYRETAKFTEPGDLIFCAVRRNSNKKNYRRGVPVDNHNFLRRFLVPKLEELGSAQDELPDVSPFLRDLYDGNWKRKGCSDPPSPRFGCNDPHQLHQADSRKRENRSR